MEREEEGRELDMSVYLGHINGKLELGNPQRIRLSVDKLCGPTFSVNPP